MNEKIVESVSGYPGIRFSGVSDSSPKVALFAWRDVTLRSFELERDGRSRTQRQLLGFIAIFSIGARGAYCRGGQMGEAFGVNEAVLVVFREGVLKHVGEK